MKRNLYKINDKYEEKNIKGNRKKYVYYYYNSLFIDMLNNYNKK